MYWGASGQPSGLHESTEARIKVQGSPCLLFLIADKDQVPLLKVEEPPTVAGRIAEFFTDLLTWRPLAQTTHNFLRGLSFHKDYYQHPHFSAWKGICFSPPGPALESLSMAVLGSLVQTRTLSSPLAPCPLSSGP